jgi:hypothetical protein
MAELHPATHVVHPPLCQTSGDVDGRVKARPRGTFLKAFILLRN